MLPTGYPTPAAVQVCLAAERCGHMRFDARADMWWSGEGFHCSEAGSGGALPGSISFWDIYRKVGWPDVVACCCRLLFAACLRCYSSYRLLDNGLCVRLSCTTETVHNILSMTKSLVAAQQASRYAANQSGIAHGE